MTFPLFRWAAMLVPVHSTSLLSLFTSARQRQEGPDILVEGAHTLQPEDTVCFNSRPLACVFFSAAYIVVKMLENCGPLGLAV